MVSDFIFYLRDNEAYLRDVKTTNISRVSAANEKDIVLATRIISYVKCDIIMPPLHFRFASQYQPVEDLFLVCTAASLFV